MCLPLFHSFLSSAFRIKSFTIKSQFQFINLSAWIVNIDMHKKIITIITIDVSEVYKCISNDYDVKIIFYGGEWVENVGKFNQNRDIELEREIEKIELKQLTSRSEVRIMKWKINNILNKFFLCTRGEKKKRKWEKWQSISGRPKDFILTNIFFTFQHYVIYTFLLSLTHTHIFC